MRQRGKQNRKTVGQGSSLQGWDLLRLWLVCLGVSAVFVALASKCSFLYPFNDWVDANIFFTMGKGMMNGRVLYRDLYDHKGPLLYFIHGIAYLISNKSFLGMYLVETVAWTVFLAGAWHVIRLYVKNAGLWVAPVLCALLVSSPSFCHGDSAEELVLPLLIWALYALLRYMKEEYPAPMGYGRVFWHGIVAGCILCTKFTLLGLYFGWTVWLMVLCFYQKEWKRGIVTGLAMLAGMAAACVPWLLYFGMHHALADWWTGYIYNNLFLYAGSGGHSLFHTVRDIVKNVLDTFLENGRYGALTIVGVVWYGLLDRRRKPAEKAGLWVVCILTAVGVCIGVKQWQPYYGLTLSVFSCLGLAALIEGIQTWGVRLKQTKALFVGCLLAGICLIYFGGNYSSSLLAKRESLVQYRFAEEMEIGEDTTLLNFGFLDGGFYTVTGIVPECRYFARLNLGLAEMSETQEQYVAEGRADYVVTREFELEERYQEKYRLIAQGEQDYEGIWYPYYLYERIE